MLRQVSGQPALECPAPERNFETIVTNLGSTKLAWINLGKLFSTTFFNCLVSKKSVTIIITTVPKIIKIHLNHRHIYRWRYKNYYNQPQCGEGEIRTHDSLRYDSFQDCCLKPLGHLSILALIKVVLKYHEKQEKSSRCGFWAYLLS